MRCRQFIFRLASRALEGPVILEGIIVAFVHKRKRIALVVYCVKKSSGNMEFRAANNIVQSLLLLQEHQLPSSLSGQSMTPVLSSHPSCHLGCFPPLLADCRSNSPLGRLSSCTSAPLPLSLVISISSEYNGSYLIPKLTVDHCQGSPPISTSSEGSGVVLKIFKAMYNRGERIIRYSNIIQIIFEYQNIRIHIRSIFSNRIIFVFVFR